MPLIPRTIDEAVWKILEGKRKTEMDVVEAVTVRKGSEEATQVTEAALQRWISASSSTLHE